MRGKNTRIENKKKLMGCDFYKFLFGKITIPFQVDEKEKFQESIFYEFNENA